MAINPIELGAALAAAATSPDLPPAAREASDKIWKKVGEEIARYLVEHATVTVSAAGLVAPSGGGPVVGVATGKIV